MSVTALLELQLKPDSLDTAHEVIHDTLAATRAFPGCVAALVMVDSQDPAHVVVVETWESLDHDRAYREWRATPEGASSLGTVLAAPPRLTVLTLAEGV